MPVTTVILFAVAIVLGLVTWTRPSRPVGRGFALAARQFSATVPRVLLALLAASFLAQLIPADVVASWLSANRGFTSLLVASGLGILVPGGAVISVPLALLMSKAGAGVPQLMAFLTSWSIFAVHRILAYEIPAVGWRFTSLRLLSACLFPLVVGLLAGLVTTFVSVGAGH